MTLGEVSAHRWDALNHGLALAGDGWALEFGVYRGHSLRMIADARPGGQVAGFDSFLGLPEDWHAEWTRGTFATERRPDVSGVEIVPGWFSDTVRPWADTHPGTIAFVHIDCDLYSSTVSVLGGIGDRLRPGCVLVFDEYHGYPGWHDHEALAWTEFAELHHLTYSLKLFEHQAVMVLL